tara:strand:- start:2 stop:478 length:477 start_codon:yes stop_codon:yes gene_type:complete
MSEFYIMVQDVDEGDEIPKKFGYKHGNESPSIFYENCPDDTKCVALIMDDPDAMGAVGKVWVHWLFYKNSKKVPLMYGVETISPDSLFPQNVIYGKTDFGEIGYGGPAPPDKRHTYVFKAYALDTTLDLNEGYSKQELEDAMKDHIIAEAKLTGTFAP